MIKNKKTISTTIIFSVLFFGLGFISGKRYYETKRDEEIKQEQLQEMVEYENEITSLKNQFCNEESAESNFTVG